MDDVRSDVAWFAVAMENTLRKHDNERGFRGWIDGNDTVWWFFERLQDEFVELKRCVLEVDPDATMEEAVDVGNFAMMIFTILNERKKKKDEVPF